MRRTDVGGFQIKHPPFLLGFHSMPGLLTQYSLTTELRCWKVFLVYMTRPGDQGITLFTDHFIELEMKLELYDEIALAPDTRKKNGESVFDQNNLKSRWLAPCR